MVSRESAGPVTGEVPLFLTDSSRSIESAPTRIYLGLVRLHAWHVHAVPPSPALETGTAAYLIRVGYDIELVPDRPEPVWFDMAFEFALEGAVVNDAIPRRSGHSGRGPFQLSLHHDFIQQAGETSNWSSDPVISSITLPDGPNGAELRRVGAAEVCWRHLRNAGHWDGPHHGWVVLITSARRRRLPVVATGAFALSDDPEAPAGQIPDARREAFTITLPRPLVTSRARTPSDPEHRETHGYLVTPEAAPGSWPRVFVSYAHESDAHKEAVARLCALLRVGGVDVRLDEWPGEEGTGRRNWHGWVMTQIDKADYVLVVASPTYRAAGRFLLAADSHRGVQAEYSVLADHLHGDRPTWTRKILPVVLPGRRVDEIPPFFEPHNADHYRVATLDATGVEGLLRTLRPAGPGAGSA